MVQNTGELHLTMVERYIPYGKIEKADGELKLSLTRSSGVVDQGPVGLNFAKGAYWIYLGNENAKELIGMGGRICNSAALASVGPEAVIDFIEKENLRAAGIVENRGVGKRHCCKDWRYAEKLDGNWDRSEAFSGKNEGITWDELPRHSIVGGDKVQEMYSNAVHLHSQKTIPKPSYFVRYDLINMLHLSEHTDLSKYIM